MLDLRLTVGDLLTALAVLVAALGIFSELQTDPNGEERHPCR